MVNDRNSKKENGEYELLLHFPYFCPIFRKKENRKAHPGDGPSQHSFHFTDRYHPVLTFCLISALP